MKIHDSVGSNASKPGYSHTSKQKQNWTRGLCTHQVLYHPGQSHTHTRAYTRSYLTIYRQQWMLHVPMAASSLVILYPVLDIQVCVYVWALCHCFVDHLYLCNFHLYLCGLWRRSGIRLFACLGQRSNTCECSRETGDEAWSFGSKLYYMWLPHSALRSIYYVQKSTYSRNPPTFQPLLFSSVVTTNWV